MFGNSPVDLMNVMSTVKEFQIYIHKREGFINTFMLNQGRPHITLPGFDERLRTQKPQAFHYVIRQVDRSFNILLSSKSNRQINPPQEN